MNTAEQLTQVFNDNFVVYFRSHAAHLNIVGRNFRSDHKLLQGVYERRQAQIDTLGELIRTVGEFAPRSIQEILNDSEIDDDEVEGDSEDLLGTVRDNLQSLRGCYEELMAVASAEGHEEIANYAQDQVLDLAKSLWMLDSTLD
jgi:starvation-inducible DNA-binding protein